MSRTPLLVLCAVIILSTLLSMVWAHNRLQDARSCQWIAAQGGNVASAPQCR